MREVKGVISLPENTPARIAKRITVTVQDVSLADAPAVVIAEQRLNDVALQPGGAIAFNLAVPEVEPQRSLTLRVHISLDGNSGLQTGDLLTTVARPVLNQGPVTGLQVPVTLL